MVNKLQPEQDQGAKATSINKAQLQNRLRISKVRSASSIAAKDVASGLSVQELHSGSWANLALLGSSLGLWKAGLGLNVVNPAHVVAEVPVAWEAISRYGSITALQLAGKGSLSMAMHGVGFTLMTEKACGR